MFYFPLILQYKQIHKHHQKRNQILFVHLNYQGMSASETQGSAKPMFIGPKSECSKLFNRLYRQPKLFQEVEGKNTSCVDAQKMFKQRMYWKYSFEYK